MRCETKFHSRLLALGGPLLSFFAELVHRLRPRAAETEAKVRLAAEREEAAAVRRERQLLRQVIDTLPLGVYVQDGEGRLCLVNQAMAHFHGSTVEAMEGRALPELPGEAWGIPRVASQVRTVQTVEEKADARGRLHTLEATCSPLFDGNGGCDKILVVTADITERRKAEESLRENRALLDSIITGTPDAVFVKDPAGRYLLFNSAAQKLVGKSAEQVLGRTDPEVFGEDAELLARDDRIAMASGSVEVFEEVLTDSEGEKHVFDTVKGPLYDDQGNLTGVFGVSREVTAQKQVEEEARRLNVDLDRRVAERTAQLEAAITEQEAFSYSVSHDLRSPLRHINSYSALLVEELGAEITPTAKEYLERIGKASSTMAKLIDDLLQLARTTRLPLNEEEIDLTRLAKIASLNLKQTDKNRRVEFRIAEGLAVLGDKTLMRLVVDNLLENAWKYTAQEKVGRIEVGSEVVDGEEVFYVSDNGTGFDMVYRDKLFQAFQRLHGAEYEGNGIGLATVRRAIERHGGSVWAEGEVGSGATFYFRLPRQAASFAEVEPQKRYG